MRVFKKNRFLGLSPRGGGGTGRASQAPTSGYDDCSSSIGSELSEGDQFDIIVPVRQKSLFSRYGGDDSSDVSSITTDDRTFRRRDATKEFDGTMPNSCCFGASTTKVSVDDSIAGPSGTTAFTLPAPAATREAPIVPQSSMFEWNCCNPKSQAEVVTPTRRLKDSGSSASLNRTSSLFDTVMSDDDELREGEVLSRIKRKKGWKPSLRRALPWRRPRYNFSRQERASRQPTT